MYYLYAVALYLLLFLLLPLILILFFLNQRVRIEIQTRILDAFHIKIKNDESLPVIWFHASSIGEMKVATRLIEEMKKEQECNIVLSVFTRTALQEAKKLEGLSGRFLLPLDFPCLMNFVVQRVKPDLLVTIESEFWLSLLHKVKKHGAKIALVNGRVSEKAFTNHQKYSYFLKTALKSYDLVLARSQEDLERLAFFLDNKKNVVVGGNIKYDINSSKNTKTKNILSSKYQYISLASTRNGEEELLLQSIGKYREEFLQYQNLKFIIIPRHVNRVQEIERLLTRYSFSYSLYSEGVQTNDEAVVLVDRFGVLNDCYFASIGAFIGGSLINTGGQNLLEAIAQGIPIVFGSDMSNFKEESRYVLQHGAVQCETSDEVIAMFLKWLEKPIEAKETGTMLKNSLNTHRGVVKRYALKLQKLLK